MSDAPTILWENDPIVSDPQADLAIARIGALSRDLARIETTKAELIAAATATAEAEATPLLAERNVLSAKVEAYCAANRARLAPEGKTVEFASGLVAWRQTSGSIEIDKALESKIIDYFRSVRGFYKRFVRVTEAVSKRAIAAATPEEKAKLGKVKGIRFVPGEEAFSITPAGASDGLADRPEAA